MRVGRPTGACAGGSCEENEGVVHRQQFLLSVHDADLRIARLVVLSMLVVSLGLLIPGLFLPVLTIRGVLTRDGIAQVAPTMLEQGLTDETMNVLKSMMNPTIVAFIEATGGDLRKIVLDKLTPQITAALQKSVGDVEVYEQTRSISGRCGGCTRSAAPCRRRSSCSSASSCRSAKLRSSAWAMFLMPTRAAQRTLAFVEAIAKWSMADVFVVALFIAYLAAQASHANLRADAAPRLSPSPRTSAPASTGSPRIACSRSHPSSSRRDLP